MGRHRTVPDATCKQCGVKFYDKNRGSRPAAFCSFGCRDLYHHGGTLMPKDSGALERARAELALAIADAQAAMKTSTLYRVWPPSTWD